jgi:predicted O-methyltransferase YrrM
MLELKSELAKHRDQLSTIENNVMLELRPQLAKHRDQLSTIENDVAKAALLTIEAPEYNRGLFQRFNRTLSEPQIQTFLSDWAKPLGLELNKARLGYLANRSCSLEGQMKGRLATSVEAVVLRCLVALATKRTEVSILEIGTLFGVGAAAVYEAAANECDSVHLTVIDPRDGYYASGHRDILTGARVNETTLRHNWSRAPIPEENYTIIKYLSTESAALEEARQREYDVLIIDGDHSFDGVKFDFEHYASMVRPGGYILFDDYDVEEWPDIKRYVDTEVVGLRTLYRIGAAFRTAVFQVRRPIKAGTSARATASPNRRRAAAMAERSVPPMPAAHKTG